MPQQTIPPCVAGNLIGAADFLWSAAVLHVLSRLDGAKFVANAHLLLRPAGGLYGWTLGSLDAHTQWQTQKIPALSGKHCTFCFEFAMYRQPQDLVRCELKW